VTLGEVLSKDAKVEGIELEEGDGVAITDITRFSIRGAAQASNSSTEDGQPAELLLFDLA
jgi:hypothetical protein